MSDASDREISAVLKRFDDLDVGRNSEWFVTYSTKREKTFSKQLESWRALLPTKPNTSIIDFGAAPFVVTESLAGSGYDVTAVDNKPENYENIDRLACSVVYGDIDLPESLEQFNGYDVAILSHVIEHLRMDMLGSLRAIRDSLQPGGLLIVETPNLLSAKGWYNILRKKTAYSCAGSLFHEWSKIDKVGHMGHVREYTIIELREILEKTGFTVINENFMDYWGGRGIKSKLVRYIQKKKPGLRQNIQLVAQA